MQPADKAVLLHTPMKEVMQTMEKSGRSILAVTGPAGEYVGFVMKAAIFNRYLAMLKRRKDFL